MPVTFSVSPVSPGTATGMDPSLTSDTELLNEACAPQAKLCREILQSSISDDERPHLSPETNGFVRTVLRAFSWHYHLHIRPDDVWMAILGQLNFYVNAHAEELRKYFVAHEDKKTLRFETIGTRYTVDYARFSHEIVRLIHENVVDSTLVEWTLPDFTTTTPKDTAICSILMMSTLKEYFEYHLRTLCGIPSVTLEGTKADWERILKRLDRLYELGDEPSAWANMLRPILSRFVSAFDGKPDIEFWSHVVHRQRGSGRDNVSGWLTAFCVWSHKGAWNAGPLPPLLAFTPKRKHAEYSNGERKANVPGSFLNARTLVRSYYRKLTSTFIALSPLAERREAHYTLDGVPYFTLGVGSIPAGYCEVDVHVDDNGQEFEGMLVAGHVASVWSSSQTGSPGVLDTISPAPQWFMFEKVPES